LPSFNTSQESQDFFFFYQLLKEREVFLSRQTETLPATLIRGKCSVTLLSEVETANSYLSREDAFYYTLVYDPQQKTLQEADQVFFALFCFAFYLTVHI